MFRSQIRTLLSVLTVLVLTVAALAQSPQDAPAPSGGSTAQPPNPSATSPLRQPPPHTQRTCWGEAGITPDKINEQWKIQDAGKVKISGVCSDPKLTPEQRLAKIHGINEETDKEISRLIPAQQLSVYKSCMTQREAAKAKAKAKGPQPKELGPCGGSVPSSSKDHGSHDHSTMGDKTN
jgi:hypothetical protein